MKWPDTRRYIMHDTLPLLNHSDFPGISRRKTEILQINIGLRCNQQCGHCHVNSSPKRTEKMDEETIAAVCNYVKIVMYIHWISLVGHQNYTRNFANW